MVDWSVYTLKKLYVSTCYQRSPNLFTLFVPLNFTSGMISPWMGLNSRGHESMARRHGENHSVRIHTNWSVWIRDEFAAMKSLWFHNERAEIAPRDVTTLILVPHQFRLTGSLFKYRVCAFGANRIYLSNVRHDTLAAYKRHDTLTANTSHANLHDCTPSF